MADLKISPNGQIAPSNRLSGRVIFLTGASVGIGRGFAHLLASHGASVAIAARRADKLAELAAEIESAGGKVFVQELDVSDASAMKAAFDAVEAALGPVDTLINNAGVADGNFAARLSVEEVDRVIDVNFRASFLMATEFARRHMKRGGPGWVVNLSSIGAYFHAANTYAALYSAAKGAIVRLTETLATEWAHFDINVNAIAPGFTRSEMTGGYFERNGEKVLKSFPRQRMAEPEDLGSTLLFLIDPASRFVTGTCIKVDDAQMPR